MFTTLAIYHQISPPTINLFFNQDERCDLITAPTARPMKIDAAKNNGFGGTNGTVASSAFRRQPDQHGAVSDHHRTAPFFFLGRALLLVVGGNWGTVLGCAQCGRRHCCRGLRSRWAHWAFLRLAGKLAALRILRFRPWALADGRRECRASRARSGGRSRSPVRFHPWLTVGRLGRRPGRGLTRSVVVRGQPLPDDFRRLRVWLRWRAISAARRATPSTVLQYQGLG